MHVYTIARITRWELAETCVRVRRDSGLSTRRGAVGCTPDVSELVLSIRFNWSIDFPIIWLYIFRYSVCPWPTTDSILPAVTGKTGQRGPGRLDVRAAVAKAVPSRTQHRALRDYTLVKFYRKRPIKLSRVDVTSFFIFFVVKKQTRTSWSTSRSRFVMSIFRTTADKLCQLKSKRPVCYVVSHLFACLHMYIIVLKYRNTII